MTVPFIHSILQVRPNRLYYLSALRHSVFSGAWGLGLPNLTTQDELVLERGVFQNGSTLTVVRLPPTREFHLNFKIKEDFTPAEYFAARRELIDIFNPIHLANAQTSGTTPSLFWYTMEIPGYTKYNIRFAYRSGLDFAESDAPDHRSFNLAVRLMSPDVTLFEDIDYINIAGNTSPVGGPYSDLIATPPFVYSGSWPARFRLVFQRTAAASISTLYSLRMRDITNSFDYIFKHVGYPATGWTFGGVVLPQTFTFDSKQEIFTYVDAAGSANDQNLTLAAHQDSNWQDFQFYPGVEYEIAVETNAVVAVSGTTPTNGLSYYPTHIGI